MGRGAAEEFDLDIFGDVERVGFDSFGPGYTLFIARDSQLVATRRLLENESLQAFFDLLADREKIDLLDQEGHLQELGETTTVFLLTQPWLEEPNLHQVFRKAAFAAHAELSASYLIVSGFGGTYMHLRETKRDEKMLCGAVVPRAATRKLTPRLRGSFEKLRSAHSGYCRECWAIAQQRSYDDPVRIAAEERRALHVVSDTTEWNARQEMAAAVTELIRDPEIDGETLLARSRELLRPLVTKHVAIALNEILSGRTPQEAWKVMLGDGRAHQDQAMKQIVKITSKRLKERKKEGVPLTFPTGEALTKICQAASERLTVRRPGGVGAAPVNANVFARVLAETDPDFLAQILSAKQDMINWIPSSGLLASRLNEMQAVADADYPAIALEAKRLRDERYAQPPPHYRHPLSI